MRLTAELIKRSLQYSNALKERELDLRGHKIPAIENLGACKDAECIDFTDNDISVLGNFPLSPHLETLLCAQNRIHTISSSLANYAPNLTTIVLTQNNLEGLADLDPLKNLASLVYLSLMGNPVCNKENYRSWIIFLCPQIRILDFQRIQDSERRTAKELFGTKAKPTDLANTISAARATQSATAIGSAPIANGHANATNLKMSDEERQRFQTLIQKAKSLDEVKKLEAMFNRGELPPGVNDADAMNET